MMSELDDCCQRCGGIVKPNDAFCSTCGQRLAAVRNPLAQGANAIKSPIEPSLATPGERKQVTVLFADIVGSTAMIRDLDLEQSTAVLDPVVRRMARAVQDHGGLLAGLMGDGLKGIFGAPIAQADHAERACVAALEIRELAGDGKPQVRIGINSGEVVMRALELGVDGDYDAMGLPVHIAARLQQLAPPGKICLSATTAQLVGSRFQLRRLGSANAKGIDHPIEMFELVRRRRGKGLWKDWEAHHLTEFVDRYEQLNLLQERLRDAASGRGQVIMVTGEAGLGKSRLVYELQRRDSLQGWTIMTAAADPHDSRAGFRPFAGMIRTWLGVGPADAASRVRAKLREHMTEFADIGAEGQAALSALLDVPTDQDLTLNGAPDLRRRIMDAILALVRQSARLHPTLLVFEDIHWLDRDSLDLLNLLEANASSMPVAIVVTSRPEAQLFGINQTSTFIPLPPLPENDARQIVDGKLGEHASLATLKDQVVARSQGTPLFLEEMLRCLIEDGTLVLRAGRYEAVGTSKPYALPDSIRGILAERIDRLPARRKEIVQIACVVGREIPVRLLCRLMDCLYADIDADLKALDDAGLLQRGSSGTEQQLSFNHVLTQEVAYTGLLQQRRKHIHGQTIAAFEALYPDRLYEHVELLAYHATQAKLWVKALEYLRRAARKSIERSGHAQAVEFLREALEALSFTEESVGKKEALELELRLLLRVAFNAIGNYSERLENLDRAQALAEKAGRRASLPTLMVSRASAMLQLGKISDSIDLCTRAGRTAARRGDHDTRVIADYMLSRSYFYSGQFRQSLASAGKAMALLQEEPVKARHGGGFGSSKVMLLTQMAQTQACLGELAEAVSNGEAALELAERLTRDFDIGLACYGLGMAHLYAGDLGQSVPMLEKGLRAVETGQPAQSIFVIHASLLAYAYLKAGAKDAASALSKRALAYHEESYHHANWSRLYGAMILRETGQAADALVLAKRASQVARKWGYVVQSVWSDLLLAQLHDGNAPRAQRYLDRAMHLSETIGMRPCLVRCLVQSGHLYRQENQPRRASEAFDRAEKLAQSIGMKL